MILRPLTLAGIIISIVTGTSLGVLGYMQTREISPLSAANTLSQALRQVSNAYVDDISEEVLLEHALEGMMVGLDDHSAYLNTTAFRDLRSSTTGRFGGIGIELGLVDGFFIVIAPMDDTPAQRAGMQPGDRITSVNDEPVRGMTLTELVSTLRGKADTEVSLGVLRFSDVAKPTSTEDEAPLSNQSRAETADDPRGSEQLQFTLTRKAITLASVRSRMLEPGYGYIRISAFQNSSGPDVASAITKLKSQSSALRGLVLDLRNNPGGTLQSSVDVADQFLDGGMIVYTQGRSENSEVEYVAKQGESLPNVPIVVLINAGSASASEIVAGALQDHGRATLMGTLSYGKGSVQTVLPLHEDRAIKLTTAYYFTPNGRSIHETGIEPDVAVEGDDETILAAAVAELERRQLAQAQQTP